MGTFKLTNLCRTFLFKNKKAQEIIIKWLLVLLIGSIIITLAIVLSERVGKVENYENNIVIGEYVDLLFNPFSSLGALASGTSKEIKLSSPIEIEIKCKNGHEFIDVGKGSEKVSREIRDKFIFSPEKINGERIYIFTRPFNLPFRVTDFIYVFPAEQNYCFLYDSRSENFVNELAQEIREEFGNSEARGNFAACSSENCCSPKSRKIAFFDADDTNVIIKDESEDASFSHGYIKINGRKTFFIGKEMILAASFSEDYECNAARVLKKVKQVSQIYAEKTRLLEQTNECSYADIREALSVLINQQNSNDFYNAALEIEETNSRLTCAAVY